MNNPRGLKSFQSLNADILSSVIYPTSPLPFFVPALDWNNIFLSVDAMSNWVNFLLRILFALGGGGGGGFLGRKRLEQLTKKPISDLMH